MCTACRSIRPGLAGEQVAGASFRSVCEPGASIANASRQGEHFPWFGSPGRATGRQAPSACAESAIPQRPEFPRIRNRRGVSRHIPVPISPASRIRRASSACTPGDLRLGVRASSNVIGSCAHHGWLPATQLGQSGIRRNRAIPDSPQTADRRAPKNQRGGGSEKLAAAGAGRGNCRPGPFWQAPEIGRRRSNQSRASV